jgi:histidine triad (HIT) family protein
MTQDYEPSVFAQMINREFPCHLIYEDDIVLAMLDDCPLAEGHSLVVPKKQIDYLFDLPDRDYTHIWRIAQYLAGPLRAATGALRVGVLVEGFAVSHAHVHLVPMRNDQQLKHGTRNRNVSSEELALVQRRILREIQIQTSRA